jgi:hypothetical protein
MREQGGVLEDEPDPAPVRRNARHVAPVEEHAPCRGRLQAGDDPQDGRLARAARAEQREPLS